MKALAFSNHGGVYDWISKKQSCDKAGLKYIHGVELYLCINLEDDYRGYHIGLYAKNLEGVKEVNSLMSLATSKGVEEDNTDRHFYYNPRISLDELMKTSDNVIITTACLASILWSGRDNEESVTKLLVWMSKNSHRCFLEIQYHNHSDQIKYNQMLEGWSVEYGISLIAGTDTHSATPYDAECRTILQKSKNSYYGDEDAFDLTWKTYEGLVNAFKEQGALSESVYMRAIHNTNDFADMIDSFELDYSFKYPTLYGDNAVDLWRETIYEKFDRKVKAGIITDIKKYQAKIKEEFDIMVEQKMESFMLFMSELIDFCEDSNIPRGFCRGSVGGSVIAYVTDIIDVDAVRWNTVFSRFVNADRVSLADVDIDFAPDDRERVYKYIIERFTPKNTSYIAQFGTLKDRGTIDVLAKGLDYHDLSEVRTIKNSFDDIMKKYTKVIQEEVNLEEFEHGSSVDMDFHKEYKKLIRNQSAVKQIDELSLEFERLKKDNKQIFYYFDGLKGTIVSKGNHPSGMIGSPITLPDNLGVFYKNGDLNMPVSQCAMKPVDSVNYIKFDILGLKAVGVSKDTYESIGSHYLKSHEIDWEDKNVWDSMTESNVGLFQFEGNYAFGLLKQFNPKRINDMSLINAALRPSGKSYRDSLISGEFHKNPSKEIDDLLMDNYGYLVYQEDTIKFLTDVCGLDGSTADTTRRAIGKKDLDLLKVQLPKIIEGYCKMSKQPKDVAIKEVQEFIQIIDDSSEYQFGFNHSTGYSMNGYASAMLRHYHPLEFTTAYLNRAETEVDINMGTDLAKLNGFSINSIKFRSSVGRYTFNKEENAIYKGIASIKYLSENLADELYELRDNKYETFVDLLIDIKEKTSCNTRQLGILIKLDFFSEFGKAKKLLNIVELQDYIGKNRISVAKAEESPFTLEQFERYSARKTPKTFMDVDFSSMVKEMVQNIPDEDLTISEKAEVQLENLGYIDLKLGVDGQNCYITSIDTKFTPRVSAVSLNDGRSLEFKVKKEYFSLLKLNVGDLIYIHDVENRQSWRVDGQHKNGKPKFEKIEGKFDLYISNCEKISEEQLYMDRSDGDIH